MNSNLIVNHQVFHTRPAPIFSSPAHVFCHTFLRQKKINNELEAKHVSLVVNHKQLSKKLTTARLDVYVGCDVELRIETHHEFVCYIWILANTTYSADVECFVKDLPDNWFSYFPGTLLTQILLSFEKAEDKNIPLDKLKNLFGSKQLIGNFVEKSAARIWTDFYANSKHSILRIHVEDFDLGPRRSGRLAQNLLELENYRSLAEISFPIAEKIVFELEDKEAQLAVILKDISSAMDTALQQESLNKLLDLSVSSEKWRNRTGHRFSATSAYKNIFQDRLSELDESLVLGYQSFATFFVRTTMPTFRTCEAANDRLNVFISRIDRAISLLSTQIRSSMEQQNNALLTSVNEQNKQQFILQKTIEAFAIVAISYHACALIKLFLESLDKQGMVINTAFWTLISVPSILLSSYALMRYIRNKVKKQLSTEP